MPPASRGIALVLTACLALTACGATGEPARKAATGTATAGTASPSPAAPEPTECPNGELIEAVEIPAVHADPVHIPEATIGGEKIPAVTVPGVDIPAQRVPAQCVEQKPAPGACLGAVHVPGTSIPGTSIPAVNVPSVSVPSVSIPSVSVPSASLKSYVAGPGEVIKGDDQIAYNIEADVLFDFGRADVKPDAEKSLTELAKSIREEVPSDAPIQIDGHTDSKGDPASNKALSERRARAIADWLATKGGIDRSRLKATGYGETKPAVPNTRPDGSDDPKAREKNRRVVVSAARS